MAGNRAGPFFHRGLKIPPPGKAGPTGNVPGHRPCRALFQERPLWGNPHQKTKEETRGAQTTAGTRGPLFKGAPSSEAPLGGSWGPERGPPPGMAVCPGPVFTPPVPEILPPNPGPLRGCPKGPPGTPICLRSPKPGRGSFGRRVGFQKGTQLAPTRSNQRAPG